MKTLFPLSISLLILLLISSACEDESPIEPDPGLRNGLAKARWISIPDDRYAAATQDMPSMGSVYDFGVSPGCQIWTGSSFTRNGQRVNGVWYFKDEVWHYFQDFEDRYPNIIDEALVSRFMFDLQSNMWFGIRNKLVKYDGFTFTEYEFPKTIERNWLKVLTIEENGGIWVGAGQYVGKFKDGVWKEWTLPTTNRTWHYDLLAEENKAWLATGDGLFILEEGQVELITEIGIQNESGQVDTFKLCTVPGVAKDAAGTVYITTNNGLFSWSGGEWSRFGPENSILTDKFVWAIETDKIGKLLFGTKNGLYRIDDQVWTYMGPSVNEVCESCEFYIEDVRTDAQNRKYVLMKDRFYLLEEF